MWESGWFCSWKSAACERNRKNKKQINKQQKQTAVSLTDVRSNRAFVFLPARPPTAVMLSAACIRVRQMPREAFYPQKKQLILLPVLFWKKSCYLFRKPCGQGKENHALKNSAERREIWKKETRECVKQGSAGTRNRRKTKRNPLSFSDEIFSHNSNHRKL